MTIVTESAVDEQAFTLTCTFDAPRDHVFAAWTDPERLARWWGPKGCTIRVVTLDLRPGGIFLYAMQTPDGGEMWGKFVYREVVVPEKLVFVNSFSDEVGGITRHPFSATWPLEVLSTVTFTEQERRTTLSLHGIPINATEEERHTFDGGRSSMTQGFGGTLDQLDEYLGNP